jgi:NAD(P)H-dependent flavin oxidoreductase YrpB (nitropropane dioxygenase family)
MGPFYTTQLTIAVSEAGGLGVLSHTNLGGKDGVKTMMKNMEEVIEHTDKPFGFNIRTARMQPDAEAMCRRIPKFIMKNPKLKEQVVYCVTSAGSPTMLPKSINWTRLKEDGSDIKHFHVAPALWLAKKVVDRVPEAGLVLTGTEGGGHQSYEKVSTLVLLQQAAKEYPDVPKIACGGYATGEGLASALALGAGAVAMGSRFIASDESEFHPDYKAIVPKAAATETDLYDGVFGPIRLWNNDYSKHKPVLKSKDDKIAQDTGMDVAKLLEANRKYELAYEGNIKDGAVLLGQSIGIIKAIEKVPDIMETIMKDAEAAIKRMSGMLS